MKLIYFSTLILGILCLTVSTQGYKHIVFMHGILAAGSEFDHFVDLVKQFHPGTPTTQIHMYEHAASLVNLGEQVDKISESVRPIFTNRSSEGTILVCFSQGGPVCRGLLSVIDQHNVDTFISLSAPLAGQFGDTNYLKYLFPTLLKDNLYKVLYTIEGQELSVGNYWYDPHHYELYQKYCNYLAVLNNESLSVNYTRSIEFRNNFLRLKKIVLIGGPDDGVITPWQSSQFAMYNSDEIVLPMNQQKWYLNDAFGLRTLDERGAITSHIIPGVKHIHWHSLDKIFHCCVLPYLS